jgi:hypothetical protein
MNLVLLSGEKIESRITLLKLRIANCELIIDNVKCRMVNSESLGE